MQEVYYISGPMTGKPDFNREAFRSMERHLLESGHRVLNPARQPEGLTYAEYMRRDLVDMAAATAVVFLPGWELSRGAALEHDVAIVLNLRREYV